ncbi:MAG: A24 family peptidase [Alphaproteobacteria bacterium]|nr:A24 family peptidase [Alphaproteobacteria bacterium]
MTIIFALLLAGAAFCAVMMGLYDWRERIIPDVYLFPFLLIGLIIVAFFPWFFDTGTAAIAALVGYLLSLGMGWAFKKKSPEAIGLGDVKLLAAGGIWLGITGLAIALIASCVLGGVWGLWKKQKFIPFAPFFFIGMIIAIISMLIF